jgi:hypothetical protein
VTVDRLILLDLNHNLVRRPFFNSVYRGPKVGINSTYKSIEEFDLVRRYNPNWIGEKIWIPAGSLNRASQLPHVPSNGCQIIYGPNIHVEDVANKPYLDHKGVTFLVPCDWVVKATEKYLPQANIVVFPYGIEIPKLDVFDKGEEIVVYIKNEKNQSVLEKEVQIIDDFARSNGLIIKLFEYGQYRKSRFLDSLKTAKFAVWLGQTESQGIALMEAWSYDVPTLVRRRDSWLDSDGEVFRAEAAPYLNSRRGKYTMSESLTASDLENFVAQLDEFDPRQSLIGYLDLATTAQRFRSIFKES